MAMKCHKPRKKTQQQKHTIVEKSATWNSKMYQVYKYEMRTR